MDDTGDMYHVDKKMAELLNGSAAGEGFRMKMGLIKKKNPVCLISSVVVSFGLISSFRRYFPLHVLS